MNKRLKPYLLVFPTCIFILAIVGVGLYTSIKQSLGIIPTLGLNEVTLGYYTEVLKDPQIIKSLVFSLYIALTSSIVSTVLGVILAYCLYKANNRRFHKVLYRLPIIIPYTVMAMMVFNLLSRSGFLSRVFFHFGMIQGIEDFPLLVFDSSGVGIIVGYILKQMPFVGMMVYGVYSGINDHMVHAAANLGATEKSVFRHVLLPLSYPAIVTAWFIIFAYSFGAFEMPFLLGSTSPKAISIFAYISYTSADLAQRPVAMVINTIIFAMTMLLTGSYFFLTRKIGSDGGGKWL